MKTQNVPGPVLLIPSGADTDTLLLAASICAGYSKAAKDAEVDIWMVSPEGRETIKARGISPEKIKEFMI